MTTNDGIQKKRYGRRAADRLRQGASTDRKNFSADSSLHNQVLLADDDFRQTAEALESIQGFLVRALHVLESDMPDQQELRSLALDTHVADEAAFLGETVEDLRRRLYEISRTVNRKSPA